MNWLVIAIGKLMVKSLRATKRGGSALPGLLAEKVRPNLMRDLLGRLPEGIVVVTGTNGKTTTTKALVQLLRSQGLRVLTNPTGSNFTRGIVSHLMEKAGPTGRLPYDIAVLELDEAYSRRFAARVAPRAVLLLNVQRDQLDRYGEIDATARMIQECAQSATETVVLNADDPRVAAIAGSLPKATRVVWFGLADELRSWMPSDDELHGVARELSRKTRENPDVYLATYKPGHMTIQAGSKAHNVKLSVDGIHNALNLTAAFATAREVIAKRHKAAGGEADKEHEAIDQALLTELGKITPAFGRGEIVQVGAKQITLALVKNPSGLRQSLASYGQEPFDAAIFAINDQFADGRDVSWLWDVDYNAVSGVKQVMASGVRAYDMALRLNYDNIQNVKIVPDPAKALSTLLAQPGDSAIVYCTYTAMLAWRKLLAKEAKLEGIWHEN